MPDNSDEMWESGPDGQEDSPDPLKSSTSLTYAVGRILILAKNDGQTKIVFLL